MKYSYYLFSFFIFLAVSFASIFFPSHFISPLIYFLPPRIAPDASCCFASAPVAGRPPRLELPHRPAASARTSPALPPRRTRPIHLRCGSSLFPNNFWGWTEPLCPTLSSPLLRTGLRHRTHGTPSFNASSRCGSRCAIHPRYRCVSPVFLGLFCCMALDMLHNLLLYGT
jgi:hypothetical protein